MVSNRRLPYVPDRGDFVWLEFDPQTGCEHKGHRPALIISPKSYNAKVGLALCCPMTNKIKGYPFEVIVSLDNKTDSAVLSDQLRSLDWQAQQAKFIGRAKAKDLSAVLDRIKLLIE